MDLLANYEAPEQRAPKLPKLKYDPVSHEFALHRGEEIIELGHKVDIAIVHLPKFPIRVLFEGAYDSKQKDPAIICGSNDGINAVATPNGAMPLVAKGGTDGVCKSCPRNTSDSNKNPNKVGKGAGACQLRYNYFGVLVDEQGVPQLDTLFLHSVPGGTAFGDEEKLQDQRLLSLAGFRNLMNRSKVINGLGAGPEELLAGGLLNALVVTLHGNVKVGSNTDMLRKFYFRCGDANGNLSFLKGLDSTGGRLTKTADYNEVFTPLGKIVEEVKAMATNYGAPMPKLGKPQESQAPQLPRAEARVVNAVLEEDFI